MLFNSIAFLVFFPVVIAIFYLIPHRFRKYHLLSASYIFYMFWRIEYIVLILISTLVDYFAARFMEKADTKKSRIKWLLVSICTNLGLLFLFKYFNFFIDSTSVMMRLIGIEVQMPTLSVLLPVGISFYTFQTMSYSIEVFKGKKKAENNIVTFALYVAFFPQLVAGPIERPNRLLPQFSRKISFDYDRFVSGLRLMLWGFFKKMVIADNLALVVDQVYGNISAYSGIHYLIATFFFAFQIYCDFSGYSDIAIGAARCLGYDLMENFRRPYHSKSIGEFWKRWHISLSTWFKDYLYIPLGGNRVKVPRYIFNLFITFLISGLWHGASWTFVVWGGLNGIYLITGIFTKKLRSRFVAAIRLNRLPWLHKLVQVATTFFLISFSWIFFRAQNIGEAIYIIRNLFKGVGEVIAKIWADLLAGHPFSTILNIFDKLGVSSYQLIILAVCLLIMEIIHISQRRFQGLEVLKSKPLIIRWLAYYFLIFIILLYARVDAVQFIYFQF